MAKLVLPGRGILSGPIDTDEVERRVASERKRDQAVAERLAQQDGLKCRLEAIMINYLRDEIAEELKVQKKVEAGSTKRHRDDFKRFREHCAGLGLPALPADPRTVAAFLTSELDKGRPHLRRLIKAISNTHRSVDLHDPTGDLLVRALLRLASDQPPSQTATPS
jgi:hypothetical protein